MTSTAWLFQCVPVGDYEHIQMFRLHYDGFFIVINRSILLGQTDCQLKISLLTTVLLAYSSLMQNLVINFPVLYKYWELLLIFILTFYDLKKYMYHH